MKKSYKLGILMSLTLFVSACQKQKTTSHTIKNQYSIEVPDFMRKTTALNQGASLQLHNEAKEFFTVVIDEPQDEFNEMMIVLENQYDANITGYSNLISDNLKLMVEENKFSQLKEIEIDSKKAKLFTIEGKVDEHDVVYHLGFIEGKKHYYQIVSWTSSKQKKANLKNMENIVLSFKEL